MSKKLLTPTCSSLHSPSQSPQDLVHAASMYPGFLSHSPQLFHSAHLQPTKRVHSIAFLPFFVFLSEFFSHFGHLHLPLHLHHDSLFIVVVASSFEWLFIDFAQEQVANAAGFRAVAVHPTRIPRTFTRVGPSDKINLMITNKIF